MKENYRSLLVLGVVMAMVWSTWLISASWANKKARGNQKLWNFEGIAVGQIPKNWKVEGTNQRGPLATWEVTTVKSAPSGEKVFALTNPNHDSGRTFNICWTDAVSFLNGEIEVRFKSNSGVVDQGGGVIWRAQDKDNYYIARFNPLEENFRIYYVERGWREKLASITINLPAGVWHKMTIIHKGTKIEGYLNDQKLLEIMDSTFTRSGGIGLWTKADAATAFDDLLVETK
ncbi:MAG: family 16 glycoside hydrolase [Syntrophobacteria bacterium]|jgi:hypothetical protein